MIHRIENKIISQQELIDNIPDLCSLIEYGKTENIKTLAGICIGNLDNLKKLLPIIQNDHIASIKSFVKGAGITNVDDILKLYNETLFSGNPGVILALVNVGINSVDEFIVLKECIKYDWSWHEMEAKVNIKAFYDVGIRKSEDFLILSDLIRSSYIRVDMIKAFHDAGINRAEDFLKLRMIIEKSNINVGIISAFSSAGINSADEFYSLYMNNLLENAKIENIERLSEAGIKSIDEFLKLSKLCTSSDTALIFDELNYAHISDENLIEILEIIGNELACQRFSLFAFLDKLKDKIPANSYDELCGLKELYNELCDKYSYSYEFDLKILLFYHKGFSIEEIGESIEHDFFSAEYENLKVIFEKYPNIGIEKLKTLKEILTYAKPKNLKIIFEKYPDIEIVKLKSLKEFLTYVKPENLKIIFEKYPDIEIVKLKKLAEFLSSVYPEIFEQIFLYFEPIELNEISNYEKLCCSGLTLPEDAVFKEDNHKGYLKYIDEIIDTSYVGDKKSKMIKKVISLSFEQAEEYLKIFKMLDDSISMDIQRVKNELIDEILDCEDPENTVKTIISIFERNNLPLTGKIFKVFELLYPKEKIEYNLQPHGSPVLHKYLDEGKSVYPLIYADLMNIAIKSGDRSLKNYINTFIGSEEVLKKFESIINDPGFNPNDKLCLEWKLEEREQEQLLYLFRKCSVLYDRYYGKDIEEGDTIEDKTLGISNISDDQLVKFYNDIKEGFHLKKGESIYDRLQRFLLGLGYHSFEEVLDKMNENKKMAHERGLKLYNESNGGKIDFPQQAFLKGVDENAFSQIINRGVTCREYLGGGENGDAAGSDCTPFDIDGWYTDSFLEGGYGNVKLIINTKNENIYNSREKGVEGYTKDKYELFKTGFLGEKHYGIRTGVPTTEIDYMIYAGNFDSKDFGTICYEIARNGYYLPITDKDGNIKFTPEMYHRIRAGFNYMEYYDGFDVEKIDGKYILKVSDNKIHRDTDNADMVKLIAENSPNNEKYRDFAKENRELAENTIEWIKKILEEKCGIKFNSKYDSSITGAELHDSGSTGRGTDIPTKDVDLDFTLIIDAKDYERVNEIKQTIHEEIGTLIKEDHDVQELGNQIKSKVNNIGKSEERPKGVPLDLLILKKSQVIDYSSSDAMKEKLDYIASNPNGGSEDLDRVRTNVIIMKKLLKAKSCYKHPEGGIAGIGVENWIVQDHGNFIEALESFEQIAYGGEYKEGKAPKPLSEFQKLYPIYDAGENYKDGCNDNFVYKLEEKGYQGTLEIIKAYRLKGIDGIREIIKEYEEDKKKYTG